MKETVLLTGSGMIAQRLAVKLEENNFIVKFLSRVKRASNYYVWDIDKRLIEKGAFNDVRHIIHLAGAGITDKRWTKKRKTEIVSSRVDSTKLLIETLKNRKIIIKNFLSASAIGYYGAETTENIYTEESFQGNDFLSDVCVQWEKATDLISILDHKCRIIKIRIGVVLSKKGGALEKMTKPIKYYLGAPLSSGRQYIPWIHLDDLCDLIIFSIENNKIRGVYNAVAPEYVNNIELTKTLAQKLKRPIFLPNLPKPILRLIFGEMSMILLGGSRVSSKKIISAGYDFKYKTVSSALENIL